MTAYISLVVCLLGAVIYVVADKFPKALELGRLAYFAGLFVFLLNIANAALHITAGH